MYVLANAKTVLLGGRTTLYPSRESVMQLWVEGFNARNACKKHMKNSAQSSQGPIIFGFLRGFRAFEAHCHRLRY